MAILQKVRVAYSDEGFDEGSDLDTNIFETAGLTQKALELNKMVGGMGFEPTTPGFGGLYSIQLS